MASYQAYCQFSANNSISFEDSSIIGVVSSNSTVSAEIVLLRFDSSGSLSSKFSIDTGFSHDDHCNPSFYRLDDSRFLAGYTGHDESSSIKIALLRNSSELIEKLDSWEVHLPNATTYVDFSIRIDNKILVITRSMNWAPTAFWFNIENGESESPFVLFPIDLSNESDFKSKRDRQRPYFLLRNFGNKTYFALNEDHPRNFRNGILSGYISKEGIFNLDGVLCTSLGLHDWNPKDSLTRLLPTGQKRIPWIWDLAVYKDSVAIAYSWTSLEQDYFELKYEHPSSLSGYSVVSYQNGSVSNNDIGRANSDFCRGERDYVGGITLHPEDDSLCLISTSFDPSNWNSLSDNSNSIYLCRFGVRSEYRINLNLGLSDSFLRPRYIRDLMGKHRFYYMKGSYTHWTDFKTDIGLFDFVKPNMCFTHVDGWHTDLTFELGTQTDHESPIRSIMQEFGKKSSIYFEWGAGESTLLAIRERIKAIVTIDSNFDLLNVLSELAIKNAANLVTYPVLHDRYSQLEWGYLRDYSNLGRAAFEYSYPFNLHRNSDLVLIDGRFRVHCFYQVATKTQVPVIIILDDYKNRQWYHSVEEFVLPHKFIGRAAIFEIHHSLTIPQSVLNAASVDQR